MTLQFDSLNTINSQGASLFWLLKDLLVTHGWTVPRSGNGTTGGAGDNISSESDLGNANSWMVLRRPDDGAEWCFARGSASTHWNILYSKGALFTGGTSSTRATATDEKYVVTTALSLIGDGVANIVMDDAAPYGFVAYVWASAAGTCMGGVIYDPMLLSFEDDPDPYICGCWVQWNYYRNISPDDGDDVARAKGWSNTTWGAIPSSYNSDAVGTISFPGNLTANPYSGSSEQPVIPPIHARSGGVWKGLSTFTRWVGASLSERDVINIGTASWVLHGHTSDRLLLPWEPGKTASVGSTVYTGQEVVTVGSTTTYTKRARDDGYDPAVVYVYWQTTDPAGAYDGVPSGTLQDTTVVGIDVA